MVMEPTICMGGGPHFGHKMPQPEIDKYNQELSCCIAQTKQLFATMPEFSRFRLTRGFVKSRDSRLPATSATSALRRSETPNLRINWWVNQSLAAICGGLFGTSAIVAKRDFRTSACALHQSSGNNDLVFAEVAEVSPSLTERDIPIGIISQRAIKSIRNRSGD